MAARIPVSWLLLLALLAVFAFFGYQILQASQEPTMEKFPPYSPADEMKPSPVLEEEESLPEARNMSEELQAAPATQRRPPIPQAMPHVPGQTEDDLRAPEPLQDSPAAIQYDSPDATDPMNRTAFMSAEFGSNLRHPEQMMEARPSASMRSAHASGVASEYSSPGGNRAIGYTPEMAQNGGDFMEGISAFDGSVAGVAYSAL
jgi:hypothetical protein